MRRKGVAAARLCLSLSLPLAPLVVLYVAWLFDFDLVRYTRIVMDFMTLQLENTGDVDELTRKSCADGGYHGIPALIID